MENLYSYYLQVLFITLIVVNHLTEIYLIRRQLQTLAHHQGQVPPEFTQVLSLPDHRKAIAYGSARLRLRGVHLLYTAILLFYWFPFRGAEALYLALPLSGIHHEVLFLVGFGVIQYLLNLPWSIYSTFVLEEKFGFNKSTPKLFVLDRLKGALLAALIGIPLIYAVLGLYQGLGQWWWLASFLLLTAMQFVLVWLYPTFIAPLFNKFSALESEELKKGIESLVARAGFRPQGVFVMDASRRSSHGNAYFTGLGKSKRVVFFDTLLKDLKNSEVLAILAHELGHLKLKHIPKSLITGLIMSFIGFWLMGQLADQSWFYSGHFFKLQAPGILLFLFMQAIPLYLFWFGPIGSWISRRREFEADAYAARETNGRDLITGLLSLYRQNASPVVTDRWYSGFYHSHPPALERIKRLESLEGQTSQ
jgi:STE24 endopeptidase